jgi:hypothetical protein
MHLQKMKTSSIFKIFLALYVSSTAIGNANEVNFIELFTDYLTKSYQPVIARVMEIEEIHAAISDPHRKAIPFFPDNSDPGSLIITFKNEFTDNLDKKYLCLKTKVALGRPGHPEGGLLEFIPQPKTRWLLILDNANTSKNEKSSCFEIKFPNKLNSMFQIKDDPLDNRLGVDLEVLYEDLQLIISHRPDWPSVPAEQLKTDFAKAILARLLGEAEQTTPTDRDEAE